MPEQELVGVIVRPGIGCRACHEEAVRAEIMELVAAGELQIVQLPDGSVVIGPTPRVRVLLPMLQDTHEVRVKR
jgi:hypothetical protein